MVSRDCERKSEFLAGLVCLEQGEILSVRLPYKSLCILFGYGLFAQLGLGAFAIQFFNLTETNTGTWFYWLFASLGLISVLFAIILLGILARVLFYAFKAHTFDRGLKEIRRHGTMVAHFEEVAKISVSKKPLDRTGSITSMWIVFKCPDKKPILMTESRFRGEMENLALWIGQFTGLKVDRVDPDSSLDV